MLKLTKSQEDEALEIHQKATVVAMHTDFIGDVSERRYKGEKEVMARRHLPVLKKGGISAICDHVIGDTFESNCFPTPILLRTFRPVKSYAVTSSKHGFRLADYMISDVEESHEDIFVANSVEDVKKAKREGKLALFLCFQGCSPIEDELALLRSFYRLGFHILCLNTSWPNQVSDCFRDKTNHGLSEFGMQVVNEAHRLRMIVDVASMSEKGFWDVLKLSKVPIISSLSNSRTVCDDPGNLTDDMIHALAENNGLMGLIANGICITKNKEPKLEDYLDHVDHIEELVGIDHVGLGPDIVEPSMYPYETYHSVWAGEQIWEGNYPKEFSGHAMVLNVTRGLVARGYSANEIEKFLGGNIMRIMRTVWGE